jgi:hypothetical protein
MAAPPPPPPAPPPPPHTQPTPPPAGAAPAGGRGGCASQSAWGPAPTNGGCNFSCYVISGKGGKGGKGGYIQSIVTVIPGFVYNISIAIGGVGGSAAPISGCGGGGYVCCGGSPTGAAGNIGGTSSFNNMLYAYGGQGGQGGSTTSNGCPNGSDGSSAIVNNYNASGIAFTTVSQTSVVAYIPQGYVTSALIPDCCADGGGGGNESRYTPYATCGSQSYPTLNQAPGNGGAGQNGYCVISY